MNQSEFSNLWQYYLVLDQDISNTTRFVEPTQKNVYSFEFQKIIILACCEIENAFKSLCNSNNNAYAGSNIGDYKKTILSCFPKITQASVTVGRTGDIIQPFIAWSTGSLAWWKTYTDIKHNRTQSFSSATYENALFCVAALYILILYLAKQNNFKRLHGESKYLTSEYTEQMMYVLPPENLPDF